MKKFLDLIKILSFSINEIKVENNWKFEFTSYPEHPILIQFDDREDEGKLLSPPTLLMALLLKEHRKVIKAETGKKPDKFGFCILDENYNNEEKERIKKGLEESCNLLKIGYNYIEI
uniref:Uncharacterized protein n=1 Tax=Panagrolaimus davidi TaxID=227884 RepID=A0A914PTN7_9BILA